MKWILGLVAAILVAVLGYAFLNAKNNTIEDMHTAVIQPIEHATALIEWGTTFIYTDPVGTQELFAGKPGANIVLVTDIHGDHLSTTTLMSMVGSSTALIVPQAVKEELPTELAARAIVLANGESADIEGIHITAVPMYNLPGSANANFHTKGRGNGYVLEKEGFRVYVAGDTAGTPEMRALTDIDIALVPMNLPYTMSVDEAADAVLAFKPKKVYPYHYRGQDGLSDVNRFKQLVDAGNAGIEVVLANWYPAQ